MQESNFSDEDYQNLRKELICECKNKILNLNTQLAEVHSKIRYIEKYKNEDAFELLNDSDLGELLREVAPIITSIDKDEFAKRFDNFMYHIIITFIENTNRFKHLKNNLQIIAKNLENKITIPQVKAKISIIKEINTDEFWENNNILLLEKIRIELRELIQFLNDEGVNKKIIITKLQDEVSENSEGVTIDVSYDFEDYNQKVNRYVNEHSDTLAIYKLTHNKPLSKEDYSELERILTVELGTKQEYEREFGETPFGILIRKIAKMDHDTIMETFSKFINDESLNSNQINFIKKIISYIEQNGYIENISELQKPPFDKPISFIKLFDTKTRQDIIETINKLKENAVNIIA